MGTAPVQFPPALVLALLGSVLVLLALAAWLIARRRAARSIPHRLRKAGDDLLAGFLMPNADAGPIHIDYAVLTRQGIVVVIVREAEGHVFGSDTMNDWTVLAASRRYTFPNPLPGLYDRIAAVRRVLPETPVRGVVAFMPGAEFSKGSPPDVVMLETLLAELAAARDAPASIPQELSLIHIYSMGHAWTCPGTERCRPPRGHRAHCSP